MYNRAIDSLFLLLIELLLLPLKLLNIAIVIIITYFYDRMALAKAMNTLM